MQAALKSEFRKLITVRSTYVIVLICLFLTVIFAFWAQGIRAVPESLSDPFMLSSQITGAIGAISLILALIGVLFITHEYRYNTIIYTLSASNSRTKTLLAKMVAATVVSLILTVFFAIISPLLARLGVALGGYELGPQTFYFQDLWWRCLFYGWGYMMFGLLLGVLFRSQAGAIVALFMTQVTIEPLIGMLIRSSGPYLPSSVLNSALVENAQLSSAKAVLIYMVYMAAGWAIAFALFLRRDAS